MSRCVISRVRRYFFWLVIPQCAWGFSYEQLEQLIIQKQVTRVEQVLRRLPQELLANYTLAYDSKSLQSGSYAFPRAILFGRDAKFIVTFNGHPEQQKFEELEVLQFRDATKKFELRSISFRNGVVFSPKNPPVCLSCHGKSPRPIWSSYEYGTVDNNHWPGFYGATHDAPRMNAIERTEFKRFREMAQTHHRYRHLKLIDHDSLWFPYGEGARQHRFRPNNRLGNLLARLNAQRIARQMLNNEFFHRNPDLSLLWVLDCPQVRSPDYLAQIRRSFTTRFERPHHSHLYTDLESLDPVHELSFMLDKLFTGLESYTWNLAPDAQRGGKRFFTGIASIDQLVRAELLRQLVRSGHWLSRYYESKSNRDLYNTFAAGYYDSNVAPGDVGRDYDALGAFYDVEKVREACTALHAGDNPA